MTEANTNNFVSINGKDYNTDEFNDEQKYLVAQLRDLQQKSENLKFQADQITAANKIFTDTLIDSVENPKEEPAAEEPVAS
ncbi:hypothetical protein OAE42_05590 [Gammaproteobacteria bacterium]|jgi:hypothetical protein|nr:hypothetical protein [Gammaproteobacteria bacterium]